MNLLRLNLKKFSAFVFERYFCWVSNSRLAAFPLSARGRHRLLGCVLSDRKSATVAFAPLSPCDVLFLLAALSVLSVSLVFSNLVTMCFGVGFFLVGLFLWFYVYPPGSSVRCLDQWVYTFHQIWKNF